jgi:hypothetical protein
MEVKLSLTGMSEGNTCRKDNGWGSEDVDVDVDLTAWAFCNRQDNGKSALEWKLPDEDRRWEMFAGKE